jgi:carbon storage regulator
MLVLNRRVGEEIVIGHNIRVTVLKVHGGRAKLGIVGPDEVPVRRMELLERTASNTHLDSRVPARLA